jgi:hypothetical protein
MRSGIRHALGIAALVQVTLVVSTASGQAADQHACSLFQPNDLLRITGRKDIGGRGPRASKPGELRAGTTECDFLNISMTLTQNMTPAWFARNRKMSEDAPDRWKVQSVSGLGDEAYYMWDPRPGSNRNVGLVFRAGSKQMAIGQLASADSIESTKPMLMQIARLLLPKMK